MRKELESIKKIEDYLSGQLSAGEKAGFEEQLANDPQLREELSLQQELMRGIERAALTQQIKQAGKQFTRWRKFTRLPWGELSILLLGAVVLYFILRPGPPTNYDGSPLPPYNEAGEKLWADADKSIAAQTFTIQAGRDTVIETKGGIVLTVPADAFMDEKGKMVTGPLSLTVKEALDAAAVMQSGLSTMSGGQLLETGGMFLIDARKGEQLVNINPRIGIYAEIPTDTIRPDMQLYSGKRLSDGRIDWVNPVALARDLVPVDILSLNFYPPLYLDSVKAWGYDSRNKAFTDSLYYSLIPIFRTWPIEGNISTPEPGSSEESLTDSLVIYSPDAGISTRGTHVKNCVLDPAKIKAIWNNAFQNTLLATREFEERLAWIHRSHQDEVLDLYINNLDKPLSYIDEQAARLTSGEIKEQFLAFAARKEGRLKNGSTAYQKLRDYYQAKTQAYAEAIRKTQQAFWKEQAALDRVADQKERDHQNDSSNRVAMNFQKEFDINLKEAARQLGYNIVRLPDNKVYKVTIVNTGWYNIDRAVYEATLNRTTLDINDATTGKKVRFRYLPVSFQVEQASEYDRLYVYLLPDGLNSFMRMEKAGGKYSESLNELMKYTLVIIGYKGEQVFHYTQDQVQPLTYGGIRLTAVSDQELQQQLNGLGKLKQGAAVQQELDYFRSEKVDQQRRKRNEDLQELLWKVISLVSCWQQRSV